ncbi:peptidase M50 [Ketogulonicigenium vulgare]|uniref:Peptidase M50 n=1 Tax=Ketogulonicigenium vulgare (strain WSH-001) TaxID=759362 RepID=F9Y5Q8_KETVW|nr:peptidase M50 [Ketogulonicigenium vulgare]ADO43715.1 peptidase M50 [Ketogulonicigenium vulgare Y25]AEM41983.1 Peptidase M50 [Ketogulonicigenium vulgare WSH-001]ALJ82080.1 peptidase M50 [Ketogulonicigenium vulgare]ANW34704.1 peptidase M50 [Ketogulonicigenium vulgare]AOZ55748.1 peptidase M50 [Ketogulonicigenium vulgare]
MIPVFDLTLWQVVLRVIGGLVAISLFGAALSWMFRLMGDSGPHYDGRSKPNPATQISWIAMVGVVLVRFGWAKPLDVDPKKLHGGAIGSVIAVLGAMAVLVLLGNLALWASAYAVTLFPPPFGLNIQNILTTLAPICAATAVINLIPLPPFAGGYVLKAVAPAVYRRMPPAWIIGAALIALFYVGRGLGLNGLLQSLASLLLPGRL